VSVVDLSGPLFFDQSSVRFEPPDTIVIVAAGRITLETVLWINKTIAEHARGEPYVLQLVDMSRMEGLSREARSVMEQSRLIESSRGMALFGGSMVMRIIAGSVVRLLRLVHMTLDPVRFFDTEALARDWIVKRRRQVRRELSLPDMPDPPDSPDRH
jgi:hypothetical protein